MNLNESVLKIAIDKKDLNINYRPERVDISVLKNRIIKKIIVSKFDNYIIFILDTNEAYIMYHEQDCCEYVSIEDITGELNNLIDRPLTMAECITNNDNPLHNNDESFLWTFYKFASNKGYVTIRWYGSSNGYYSESVTFAKYDINKLEGLV